MAIKFIDLGRQLDPEGPRMFGFWGAETPERIPGFLEFGDHASDSWSHWSDFYADFDGHYNGFDPPESPESADDFLLLCPDWVFSNPDRQSLPSSIPSLIRVAADCCKEAREEGLGAALMEAAAEVEKLLYLKDKDDPSSQSPCDHPRPTIDVSNTLQRLTITDIGRVTHALETRSSSGTYRLQLTDTNGVTRHFFAGEVIGHDLVFDPNGIANYQFDGDDGRRYLFSVDRDTQIGRVETRATNR